MNPFRIARRMSVRRTMLLVVAAALAYCLLLHNDEEPGVYLDGFGFRAGVCREDWAGRALLPDGSKGELGWKAGIWSSRKNRPVVAGAFLRDGRTVVVTPFGKLVI
jgi:hypothetical protein